MRKLLGLCIAILTDVSCGLIFAHLATKFIEPQDASIYAEGIFYSLLPDIDIILQKLSKNPEIDSTHHVWLTHWPLVLTPLVIVYKGFVTLVNQWSLLWIFFPAACLLTHYIHDSIEGVHGIKWLEPFSDNQYQFFQKQQGRWYWVYVWTPKKLKQVKPETLDEWLEKYFLKLTPASVSGVLLFIIAIAMIALW